MGIIQFIYIEQLEMLGFTKKYRYFTLLFISMIMIFLTIKPVITQIIHRKYNLLLTFIFTSSLLLNIILIISKQQNDNSIIEVGLQSLFSFGLIISVFLLFKALQQIVKRRMTLK